MIMWCVVLISVCVLRMENGCDNKRENIYVIMFISSVASLVLNIIALVVNVIDLVGIIG